MPPTRRRMLAVLAALRIESTQLRDRNGAVEIRFVNALQEITYLDRSRLVAVDHGPAIIAAAT